MAKRSYTKRDQSYWEKMSQPKSVMHIESSFASFDLPESCGASFQPFSKETAIASRLDSSEPRSTRINRSMITDKPDRFSQIRQMELPYQYRNGKVDIRDCIVLSQKAYANVPVYRNAIDLMSEFSNTDLFLEGGTKNSRDFITRWFKRIGISRLKDQLFRDYFRAGNVFLYRLDGQIKIDDFMKLSSIYAEDGNLSGSTIPIKYIVLSPYDMVANNSTVFYETGYEKVLSGPEVSRLKSPTNDDERAVFESLPEEIKKKIKKNNFNSDGIHWKLDPSKLYAVFYKKQDYEPFGIPFGYPVLDDINAKIEMKRADQAILRTIESVILHVKHGEKKDQHGGGINQEVGKALKGIFANGTTGRTLVTDYTVGADFVIPDLKKVLGPEKYQILNQDIREGLQNIIIGEEKYGNTQTKVQVFLDKLKEARQAILDFFLNPEIKRVCKTMGFRTAPIAKFTDTDIKNNADMMRVAVRMAELGILDPKSLLDTIQRGEFPNIEDVKLEQEEYVSERKKGKWNPLTPVPVVSPPPPPLDPNRKNEGGGQANPKKAESVSRPGRPNGAKASESVVAIGSIKEIARAASNLQTSVEKMLRSHYGVKKLNKDQISVAKEFSQKIVPCASPEKWETLAKECVEDSNKLLALQPVENVVELMNESGLSEFEAGLYYWASV